jgi:hypothetical protein
VAPLSGKVMAVLPVSGREAAGITSVCPRVRVGLGGTFYVAIRELLSHE